MGLSPAPTTARTLTEALRALPRADLVSLLRLRPDLTYPLPRDLSELAAQAITSASIRRAVDRLDAWQRQVLEALATLGDEAGIDDLVELELHPRDAVVRAVGQLRARALLWGPDTGLHLVRGVRDFFGPYPAGLAPPSGQSMSGAEIDAALNACGPSVEPVLDRLLWGPPTGAVRQADRTITPAAAQSPIEQLLAHRLLRPLGPDTVILPREVSWRLRGRDGHPRLVRDPAPAEPPSITGPIRRLDLVERAGAGAGLVLLHDVDLTVHVLADEPVALLRDGGMAARDLNGLARRLAGENGYACFVIEIATAAGLLSARPGQRLLPTPAYDRWLAESSPDRWLRLAEAWRVAGRYFSAGTADGGHPLGAESASSRAVETRTALLSAAAGAEPGTVLDAEQLAAALRWRRPALTRPDQLLRQVVAWTLAEAGWLGLTALGATTGFLTALATGSPLPDVLRRHFPEPIEQIIIQSDLTAVAPGPLAPRVATDLRLMAEEESRGGGSVYRFSPTSLRRAFDAGWAAGDLHDWLGQHSSTGVPQPLGYLIDDVARQHGTIRVGPARAVLRIEDQAQQAALLGHPESGPLRLRVLAPGVLAADAEPEDVIEVLQRLGLKPVAEDAGGTTLRARPPERAPAGPAGASGVVGLGSSTPSTTDPETAADIIVAADRRRAPDLPATEESLARLDRAAEQQQPVTVGYVGVDGDSAERRLTGLRLTPGHLEATDATTGDQVRIPLSRLTRVDT